MPNSEVILDSLLRTACSLDGSTVLVFTVRSAIRLVSSAPMDLNSSRLGFIIPSIIKHRCCYYSIWLVHILVELEFSGFPRLLKEVFLFDLGIEIEKWLLFESSKLEISKYRDIRREFTEVNYYRIYLLQAGEDSDYLTTLFPKVSQLPIWHRKR